MELNINKDLFKIIHKESTDFSNIMFEQFAYFCLKSVTELKVTSGLLKMGSTISFKITHFPPSMTTA